MTGAASNLRVKRSNQDLVRVVLAISAILLVTHTPGLCVQLVTLYLRNRHLAPRYRLWIKLVRGVSMLFTAVSAGMTTGVYYRLSTNYRNTFLVVFRCVRVRQRSSEQQAEK